MPQRWFKTLGAPLLMSTMLFLEGCMTFRETPSRLNQYFKENQSNGKLASYQAGGTKFHYAEAGDSLKPVVIFVHGSPGSLSAFVHFLTDSLLLKQAQMVTVDRPGFGYSNFGYGEKSLEKQAATLKPLVEKYGEDRRIFLVGHSLGGPVIARMAMDYPQYIDGLVFVAASVDPDLEPNELWFRAPLATPFLSWILPRSLRASNEEIYHLKPELQKMISLWPKISCPTVVIHGTSDNLVHVGNVDFLKKVLTNSKVEIVKREQMNHFVPWTHPELIREAALRLIRTDSALSITTDY